MSDELLKAAKAVIRRWLHGDVVIGHGVACDPVCDDFDELAIRIAQATQKDSD